MFLINFWWWLQHLIGADNGSGPVYLFWSGFFGDMTIFTGVFMLYRKHNCHVTTCPRIGRHRVKGHQGEEYVVCKRHHPIHHGKKITHHDIYLSHKKAQKTKML